MLHSNLGGAVGVALKVGPFTPVVCNGAEDGGDVDDGCSVDSHPGRLSCSGLQQGQEGLGTRAL